MKPFKKISVLALLFACSTGLLAQESGKTSMDDIMRSNGRIYVVVAVMLTILAGLVLYLVRIDRKIRKVESQVDRKPHSK